MHVANMAALAWVFNEVICFAVEDSANHFRLYKPMPPVNYTYHEESWRTRSLALRPHHPEISRPGVPWPAN